MSEVTERINALAGVDIVVGEVDFEPIKTLRLSDVSVLGKDGDSLFFAKEVRLDIEGFDFRNRSLILGAVKLDSLSFFLKKYKGESGPLSSNIGRFISSMKGLAGNKAEKNRKKKKKSPWVLDLARLELCNSTFGYYNTAYQEKEFGINWKDIECHSLNALFTDFDLDGDISFRLKRLSCREKSGLELKNISGKVKFLPGKVDVRELDIALPQSHLDIDRLAFSWDRASEGWHNYVQCINQYVGIADGTYVSFKDLCYFAPTLRGIESVVECVGKVTGPVCRMQGSGLNFIIDRKTSFDADFTLTGLPDARNMIMDIRLDEAHLSPSGLSEIYLPWIEGNIPVPKQLFVFSDIYSRNLTLYGKPTDFKVKMSSLTDGITGDLTFDLLSQMQKNGKRVTEYGGDFNMSSVDLGRIVSFPLLGSASLKGILSGNNASGKSDVRVEVYADSVPLGKSFVDSVGAYVFVKDQGVNIFAGVEDPDVKANGILSLERGGTRSGYDFISAKLSLAADSINHFGFELADSIESFMLGVNMVSVNSNGIGYTDVSFDSLRYNNTRGKFVVDSLTLNLSNNKDNSDLSVRSDLLDVTVKGELQRLLDKSSPALFVNRYFPSLLSDSVRTLYGIPRNRSLEGLSLKGNLKTKELGKALSVLMPEVYVSGNTSIDIESGEDDRLEFSLYSDSLRYKKFSLSNTDIRLNGFPSEMDLSIMSDKFMCDSMLTASNITNKCSMRTDSLYNRLRWSNYGSIANTGNISFGVGLDRVADILDLNLKIDNSRFVLADSVWNVAPSRIRWYGDELDVDNFLLKKGEAYYSLEGNISRDTLSTLELRLNDISLSNIDRFVFPHGNARLFGNLSGYCEIGDFYRNRRMELGFNLKQWGLRNDTLGNFSMSSMWDFNANKLIVQGINKYHDIVPFYLYGSYSPTTDDIDIEVKLKTLSLPGFNNYVNKFIRFNSGSVSGELNCGGTISSPQVYGALTVDSADVYVNMFNTSFKVNDNMKIKGNRVLVDKVKVSDVNGNPAVLDGMYDLISRNYDFTAHLDNFLVMDTHTSFGANFYGKLSAGGVAHIDNRNKELNIAMDVVTGENSTLFLPLVFEMEDADKILSFVKPAHKRFKGEKLIKSTIPINLDANFEVNENLKMQVIFDPSVGDILTSVGSGNVKLTMDKNKGLGMSGEYIVKEGDYLFTLGGIWNKRFNIRNGGSIIWNGTPLDATLDLTAVYGVKASLTDLYLGLNDNMDAESGRKVPVECVLSLKDRLLNPVIKLDVKFPTLDNQTSVYLKSTMSSQDELNKQVFSLLLMNKFMAPDYASNKNLGTHASAAGVTTLTELVSSKLSQWLSSFSNAVDVGVSYRMGDELTSDEIELALSTNLFNDRVTISANGNVDVGNNENAANSNVNNGIAGDFDMDFKLNKQGTLQLKAYSHTDEKILYNSTETIQGIGISYQEYFDRFGDLLRKYFSFFKKKENRKDE